jgi:protease-4
MTQASDQRPGFFSRFFTRIFCTIGIMTTITVAGIIFGASQIAPEENAELPEKILLTFDFDGELAEVPGRPSFTGPLLASTVILQDVVSAIDTAANDARVEGMAVNLSDAGTGLAGVQEIRNALARFRAAGKFAYVYSNSYGGGMAGGMSDYYLASSFSEVWMQPVGTVAINGVSVEIPFFKEIFDKIGVNPQFSHKGRYKSAPESLTSTEMSADSREMMNAVVSDISDQMVSDISRARGLSPDILRQYIDISPFGEEDALKMRLIDKVGYEDQMLRAAAAKIGVTEDDAIDLLDYADAVEHTGGEFKKFADRHMKKETPAEPKIALITGAGEVTDAGSDVLSAEDITEAFRTAREDGDVKAVVFRIDSPGGSPEAAESIRRAVIRMKETGRPVVVSMGGYAASGGYWIAAPADKIVAQPGTLTGSIGVFGGKITLEKLWEKIGVKWDSVESGKNARMFSMNRPFTPEEYARFDAQLDRIYDAFIARVAEGRKMKKEDVEALAEGRVYTGRQAKVKGLVDELGGVDRAVEIAKQLAKIDPAQKILVEVYPPEKSKFELIMEMLTGEDMAAGQVRLSSDMVEKFLRTQSETLRAPTMIVR